AERARRHVDDPGFDGERLARHLRERGEAILDSWAEILGAAAEGSGQRCYSPYDEVKQGKALLRGIEERSSLGEHDRKFTAPTSMRDVESTVHIWVDRGAIWGSR
ncbi:MAG: hypothetical protein KDK70_35385, partial [Myxococcales bacterium]|nr:hypothetical protein [Myxococcales bacterium]